MLWKMRTDKPIVMPRGTPNDNREPTAIVAHRFVTKQRMMIGGADAKPKTTTAPSENLSRWERKGNTSNCPAEKITV